MANDNRNKYSGRTWTDQQILDAIMRWNDEKGGPPSFAEWMNAGPWWPSAFTVRVRCGSWKAALEICGLEPRRSGHRSPYVIPLGEALALREEGLTNYEIATHFGCSVTKVRAVIGSQRPQRMTRQRVPKTAAERREARIAALQKALEKESG